MRTSKKATELEHSLIEPLKTNSLNRSSQYSKRLLIENYIIIWLTSDTDKDESSIQYLQNLFHSFRSFTDIDDFFAFIIQVKREKLFLIISEVFAEKIISLIHKMTPIIAIYILSNDRSTYTQWINQYQKIKGTFSNIDSICKDLQQQIHLSQNDIISIEILNSSTTIIQYLMQEILLNETDYNEKSKQDFILFARQHYPNESDLINTFAEDYSPSKAIWWYTRKCFLYHAIYQAFRTGNIALLIQMGFFIRDLHQQIHRLYEEINTSNTAIVYRGQGISENELQSIRDNPDGLLLFKNFLSTNTDRNIALSSSHAARNTTDLYGVLFRIQINSSIAFIALEILGDHFNSKDEIFFCIDSIFRIGEIKEIETKIWQINLTLIQHTDPQLNTYLQSLKYIEGNHAWQKLGFYFIKNNQYDQAEGLYKTLNDSRLINDPKQLSLLHEQLGFIYHKKNNSKQSLLHYKKSLKNYLIFLSPNDSILLPIYVNIGILFRQQNNSKEAIKHFKYALNIALHFPPPIDYNQIAILYHHLAEINEEDGIFVDAIQSYQSALENELHQIPLQHLLIAKTYNKIGEIYYRMEEYTHAFSYFDKTLQIEKKALSPNHQILAVTYYNLARASDGLQQHKEAVEYAARAVNIARHAFGSHHHDVKLYENYLDELREKTFIGVLPNGAVYE